MMSEKDSEEYQRSVDQFWHKYLSILEKASIHKNARRWYCKHVKAYIAAYPEVKLQQHLPHHVDKYQNAKRRIT